MISCGVGRITTFMKPDLCMRIIMIKYQVLLLLLLLLLFKTILLVRLLFYSNWSLILVLLQSIIS